MAVDSNSGRCSSSDRIMGILEEEIERTIPSLQLIVGCKRSVEATETHRFYADYVKEFSSLMLDIKNMSEDKLFNFISGLQSWAQLELRRLGVKDLAATVAATDGLLDYKLSKDSVLETSKSKKKGREKNGEKKASFKKGKDKSKYKQKGESSSHSQNDGGKSNKRCFICDGPHRAKDCPKQKKLNVIVAEDDWGDTGDDSPTRVNS